MTPGDAAAGLSRPQRETLRAVVNRIVPPDEETVGGVESGALEYLLHQLGPGGDLHGLLSDYSVGLATIDDLATTTHGVPFATLDPAHQDDHLRAFAAREGRFFSLMVEQVQEGFYTSPAGLAMIGWKVTG